ncbi:hypothetical protein P3T22_004097 [Paraburkholderia sp. GAS348]
MPYQLRKKECPAGYNQYGDIYRALRTEGRPQAPKPRLFKRADPVDGLFDPFDRNNL